MTEEPDDLVPPGRLRPMQIVAGSLVMGLVTFLVIALYVVQVQHNGQGLAPPRDVPVLSLVALGMLAVMTLTSLVVPGALVRQGLQRIASGTWRPPPGATTDYTTDASKVLALRQSTLIVALALIQGAGFFGGIAYLLEGRPFALGVAGLALLMMLARFPTAGRLRVWMRQQLDRLEQARREADNPE